MIGGHLVGAIIKPSVYIIGGPNGAGKTTFAREFLPNYADCKNFINADLLPKVYHRSRLKLPPSVPGG
jgi:ABC-type Mn2+/Zn2+ transport system ATPase subunit